MMIQSTLDKVLDRSDLGEKEAATMMSHIMTGRASPSQTAAYLAALRAKGETTAEITGSARSLRRYGLRVETGFPDLLDLCGTGGDGKGTFNISTTAAFVVAGAGVRVAKHGNRAVSSRCGSADLLEALGVNIQLGPRGIAACLTEAGIAFMFAPRYHPAMKQVSPVRRELGVRTIFNLIGPLANPAGVRHQLVGVYHAGLMEKYAGALARLGADRAVILHGRGGYDEATPVGPIQGIILKSGWTIPLTLDPKDLGIPRARPLHLRGGTPRENAAMTLSLLEGEAGPRSDAVLLNAALGLLAAGRVENPREGLDAAREALASGRAMRSLSRLIEVSQAAGREDD